MWSLKKKIVSCMLAVMCVMPWLNISTCESAEVLNWKVGDETVTVPAEVLSLLLDAEQAQANGDYLTELKYVEEGVERFPNEAIFYYMRAALYPMPEVGKKEKVMENLDKAIELNPDFIRAYYYRGEQYIYRMEYDKAVADFTRTIALQPDSVYSYYMRACAYYKKKEIDNTIADYSKVIELAPERSDFERFERARLYFTQGKYDDAILDCNVLIQNNKEMRGARGKGDNSDVKGVRMLIGPYGLYYSANDYDEEHKDYNRRFLDSRSSLSKVYILRGKNYYAQGKYREALADGKEVIAQNPKSKAAKELIEKAEAALKNK